MAVIGVVVDALRHDARAEALVEPMRVLEALVAPDREPAPAARACASSITARRSAEPLPRPRASPRT
jgi:hypothetical protein